MIIYWLVVCVSLQTGIILEQLQNYLFCQSTENKA